MTNYVKNFGKIENLTIRSSRGTPVAYFNVTGADGKFNRACAAFGAERVEKVKAIGNDGRIWVRGEIVEMNRKNEKGNSYKEPVLKVYNVKDLDAADAEKAAQKAAEEAAAEEAAEAGEAAEAAADEGAVTEGTEAPVTATTDEDEIPF